MGADHDRMGWMESLGVLPLVGFLFMLADLGLRTAEGAVTVATAKVATGALVEWPLVQVTEVTVAFHTALHSHCTIPNATEAIGKSNEWGATRPPKMRPYQPGCDPPARYENNHIRNSTALLAV